MRMFPVCRLAFAGIAMLAVPTGRPQTGPSPLPGSGFEPGPETLSYSIEWRLIYAGYARLSFVPQAGGNLREWESNLHLESAGLVSKLFKLEDNYRVELEDQFCATQSDFNATEGKRRRETKVTFDRNARRATYLEMDLLKNSVVKSAGTEIPACVSDVIGGLYKLRTVHLEPGQSTELALSDGKKSVEAKVEAQQREDIDTKAGHFKTIRYEAYVFNGVLYKKSARLQFWVTDDSRRVPVQLRARMPFPIGTITFQLDKAERT